MRELEGQKQKPTITGRRQKELDEAVKAIGTNVSGVQGDVVQLADLDRVLEGETRSRRSVTNVGMRPTFNGASFSVETHLLDFSGEITAKRMEVRFWKRLRAEKNSPATEELRAQIARDIAAARRFWKRLRRYRTARQPV